MKGPKVPSEARSAKRRSAEEVESGEGCRSPCPVWGSGGIFEKSMLKLYIFLYTIINVWRVTPVAKQSFVCNSGANFFNP